MLGQPIRWLTLSIPCTRLEVSQFQAKYDKGTKKKKSSRILKLPCLGYEPTALKHTTGRELKEKREKEKRERREQE